MESFEGKLAVVTGGGTGMGRELVLQLLAQGCAVATCDVILENLEETARLAAEQSPAVRLTTHRADVASEEDVDRFRDEVLAAHDTDHVHLVFNNAGVGGGGSFVAGDRAEWERTFGICWGGVYNGCRAFVPLLVAAPEGHLVNTSSVNGFWASLGPGVPHTAYSAAKFAVKGFSEALLEDLRINAPHVGVSVVMPGHIGTDIVKNSRAILASTEGPGSPEGLDNVRESMARRGMDVTEMTDEQLAQMGEVMATMFRESAPCTAAQAATIILDGVKAGRWRILVGEDAHRLDERVRSDPETVYGPDGVSLFEFLGNG